MTTRTHIARPPLPGEHGKWHVANLVTETAACGAPILLDVNGGEGIHFETGEKPHPIVCRNCVRTVNARDAK